jgi:hypothetical protein
MESLDFCVHFKIIICLEMFAKQFVKPAISARISSGNNSPEKYQNDDQFSSLLTNFHQIRPIFIKFDRFSSIGES